MLDDAMFEIVEYLDVNDSINVMKTNKKWKSFISFKYLLQRDYPLAYEICSIEHLNFTDYYQRMKKQIYLDVSYAAIQYEHFIKHSNGKPNMDICQQALIFLRICASTKLEYFAALANLCAYIGKYQEFEYKSIQYSDIIFKIVNKDPQRCISLKGYFDFLGRIYAENNQSSKAIWFFEKGLEHKEFKCFETVVCHYTNLFSRCDFDIYCSKAMELFPLNRCYILYGRSIHIKCKLDEKIQLLTEAFEEIDPIHNFKFHILQSLCHCLNTNKQFKLEVYYRKLQIEIADVTKIMGCYALLVKTLIIDLKNFKEARNLLQFFFTKYGHLISLEVKHLCRRFILELLLSQNAINDLIEQLSEFDSDVNLDDFHCVINYLNGNYGHLKTNFILLPTTEIIQLDEDDQIEVKNLFKNGHNRHIRYLLRSKLKLNLSIHTEIEYLKLNPTKTNMLELALQENNNEYLQKSLAMKTQPDFDYQDTLQLIYSSSSCLVSSSA